MPVLLQHVRASVGTHITVRCQNKIDCSGISRKAPQDHCYSKRDFKPEILQKPVWWPGSALTRWGSLSALRPHRHPSRNEGAYFYGEGSRGQGWEGKGRREGEDGREGEEGRVPYTCLTFSFRKRIVCLCGCFIQRATVRHHSALEHSSVEWRSRSQSSSLATSSSSTVVGVVATSRPITPPSNCSHRCHRQFPPAVQKAMAFKNKKNCFFWFFGFVVFMVFRF